MSRGGSIRNQTDHGLAYERRGAGHPVLLLHGWCLDRRMWMYAEDRLSSTYDVVSIDLPGFGLASAATGPYRIERHAAAVTALLDELDLRNAVVVGFAFGGAVAMTAAVESANRLAGLVVVGIPSARYFPGERMIRSMRRDWPAFARRSARVLCPGSEVSATRDWLEAMYVATRLDVALEVAAELDAFEPLPLAERCSVAALYCHGADDDVVPPSVSEECAQAGSASAAEVFERCGHLVPLAAREPFHESLTTFLAQRDVPVPNRGPEG